MSVGSWISKKSHRAAEMVELVSRYAADQETRKTLLGVYASLSNRARYDDVVEMRLRIANTVFPFRMRLSDIFIVGEILHEQQYRLQSKLPRSPVIVDLGANIGVSVLWFIAHFPDAKIHAFEPSRDNLEFLEVNTDDLTNVHVERAAVGAASGEATLGYGEFAGMHSLLIPGDGESVPTITLADYMELAGISRINLLKIDIEGSELDALKGLGERAADVEVIVGEVHELLVDQVEFYDYLTMRGFRILWKRAFHEGKEQKVHGFEAARAA